MNKRLSILHFNILEKYPPAINLIQDILTQHPEYTMTIITSYNSSPYTNLNLSNVKIFRLGSVSKITIVRYFAYINYNILGTFLLLITKPEFVLVYESLSIFPAYIYSIFFPKKKIHIHFHEYVSLPEKKVASGYMKFLMKCEEKLLQKYTSSQTNEERKELFLEDNVKMKKQNVLVFPNMPPKSWWTEFGQNKKPWNGDRIKLVYVGVLDAETMYLEEILRCVNQHPDEVELTLISQDVSLNARHLISQFAAKNIVLKSAINYIKLPNELVKYDIGLVLYKGHIPNYVYNVPNKVYEYLVCGLSVLADEVNQSLVKLENPKIYQVSFQSLNLINLIKIFHKSQLNINNNINESTNSLLSIITEN